MSEFRADNFQLTNIADKIGDNGYLTVTASPTRAGVFRYRQNGRVVRELRSEEEVFKAQSLDTLKLVPLISEADHLKCLRGEALPNEPYKFRQLGVVGENVVRNDQDGVDCVVSVYDPATIFSIDDKENIELSAGYHVKKIVKEPGTYKGERYDQKQEGIVYGHVALVRRGNAGSSCRLRIDTGAAFLSNSNEEDSVVTVENIVKKEIPAYTVGKGDHAVRLDSLVIEETPETIKLLGQRAKLISEVKKAQSRADRAEGERDSLRVDKEAVDEKLKKAIPAERYDSDVKEGRVLSKMAEEAGVENSEDMSNTEMKKAICQKVHQGKLEEARLDGDYLEGMFAPIKTEWKHNLSRIRTMKGLKNNPKGAGATPPGFEDQTGEIDYSQKT